MITLKVWELVSKKIPNDLLVLPESNDVWKDLEQNIVYTYVKKPEKI